MIKDLENAVTNFVLVLPFLSKKIVKSLSKEIFVGQSNKMLVLPCLDSVSIDYREKYSKDIEQLTDFGYEIRYKQRVQQSFAVVDDKIIWMLPEKYNDAEEVALRMYSSDIAGKLVKHYLG